jgi:hypothetical protein
LSDKDFKVKNKLQVKGITSAGPVVSDASGNLDSTAYVATQYGGTGTTTSPTSGQILYSSSGTTYAPTTLTSLDVKGATYSENAPSSPVVGQIWVESDSSADSFDPNIIRRQAFTSTAAQTVYTTSIAFIEGYEQVYFNGLLLLRGTDYTTSNSNTVTLGVAAAVNDIVEVVTVTNLNSVDTYTQGEIDAAYVSKSGGSAVTVSSGSTVPLTIQNNGTGNSFVVNDTSSDTTPFTIDANGLVWVGNTTDLPNIPELNMILSTETAAGMSLVARKSVDAASSSNISVARSRGTNASPTALQNNDNIGAYTFHAYDGTNYLQTAYILSSVDGTPGTGDMPSRMAFYTGADGSSAGSERMRIDSSGSVGIGTTAPTTKFHVETSGTNYITSRNGAAGAGIAGFICQNSGDTRGMHINGSTLHLYDYSAGASRMAIDSSGKVGIGTSSPAAKLHIDNTGGGQSPLRVKPPTGGYNALELVSGYTGNMSWGLNDAGGSGAMYFYQYDSSGSYTRTPLTIESSGTFTLSYVDASAPILYNTANNNNKLMVFEGYAGNKWNLWGGHGGGSYFGISENASSTPVFAITGSTNHVLVGYTSSQGSYKLQVNSQIFATSSSIATSDGRFKENVDTINGGLGIIDSLRPVSFSWKDHPVHNFVEGKTVGFIAQEVQEALSGYDWVDNIIKTNTSEAVLDEEGNEVTPAEEFLGIAESNIIPLLVAAVKELKARVETLENNNV